MSLHFTAGCNQGQDRFLQTESCESSEKAVGRWEVRAGRESWESPGDRLLMRVGPQLGHATGQGLLVHTEEEMGSGLRAHLWQKPRDEHEHASGILRRKNCLIRR